MVARSHGGPEVIERKSFDPGAPGPGELLLEQEAVGLNFIDIYYRTGLYSAEPPVALGAEGVGRIVAIGANTSGFALGDRLGCVNGAGAYATHRMIAAERAVRIPDDISSEVAAATMLKGFTACYLAEDTASVGPGSTALVHSDRREASARSSSRGCETWASRWSRTSDQRRRPQTLPPSTCCAGISINWLKILRKSRPERASTWCSTASDRQAGKRRSRA